MAGILAACRAAAPTAGVSPRANDPALADHMTKQLTRAAADWNRGDLEGFVSDYAPESTTTFVDGYRPRRGFKYIHDRYGLRFQPGVRRDSLHFEEIEARSLSPALALVTGRFILQRGGQTTASGPFTLVMELRPEGWRILHDHTSSDPH
jgi:ketosteroid isomerase-like protein